jgi:hypothetical protein
MEVVGWDKMNPVRRVVLPKDKVEYQSGRYVSGMYFVCSSQQEMLDLAKIGGFRQNTILEQEKINALAEKAHWEAVRAHALAQGAVFVQLSPRKYVLVALSPTSCNVGAGAAGDFYAKVTGEVVFSGSFDSCVREFEGWADPLPLRLRPDIRSIR